MRRWILKRNNGQVVSICESRPEQVGNLEIQQINITQAELEQVKRYIGTREENGKLISTDHDHVPVEIRNLVVKLKDKKKLTSDEKDAILGALIEKLL